MPTASAAADRIGPGALMAEAIARRRRPAAALLAMNPRGRWGDKRWMILPLAAYAGGRARLAPTRSGKRQYSMLRDNTAPDRKARIIALLAMVDVEMDVATAGEGALTINKTSVDQTSSLSLFAFAPPKVAIASCNASKAAHPLQRGDASGS
jgi:hypothetical protein